MPAARAAFAALALSTSGCSVGASNGAVPIPSQAPESPTEARPDALPRLEASVEAVGDEPDQHALARVLGQLARAFSPVSRATSLRLQELAQRLDQSPPGLLTHPGLFKEGLSILLDGLVAVRVPTPERAGYRRALLAFDQTSAAVRGLVSFEEQAGNIQAALRAATDAVFMARGETPPFDEAASLAVPALPIGTLSHELEQARVAISELARADWMGSRRAASQALSALADVVEAADTGKQVGAAIHDARFQAERLSLSETRSMYHGKWVKVALSRVLDAWEVLAEGQGASPIWGSSARAAVAAIDERSELSFQRGIIQDAFRTTLVVFVAATETGPWRSDQQADRPASIAPAAPGLN